MTSDRQDASSFAFKTLVAIFIGWGLICLCDAAEYTEIIGDRTESALRSVIFAVVVCVILYLASRSSLTRRQRLTLLFFAIVSLAQLRQ
jgi:hypothetical protein